MKTEIKDAPQEIILIIGGCYEMDHLEKLGYGVEPIESGIFYIYYIVSKEDINYIAKHINHPEYGDLVKIIKQADDNSGRDIMFEMEDETLREQSYIENEYISVGCELILDRPKPDWDSELSIKVYKDALFYATKEHNKEKIEFYTKKLIECYKGG